MLVSTVQAEPVLRDILRNSRRNAYFARSTARVIVLKI